MKTSLIVWSLTVSMLCGAWPAHAATAAQPAGAKGKAAGTPGRVQNCSWDNPGHNPYMGDLPSAIDRYTDISPAVRERLKKRMAARQYDEMVSIRRDSIVGKDVYQSAIRDMHFGNGGICNTVTRNKWSADAEERGLVYCDSGECILVPTVCRNVSRISRAGGPGGAAAAGPSELTFDPPAAGNPAVAAAPDNLESLPPTGAGTPATGLAVVPTGAPILAGPIIGSGGNGGQPVLGGPISIPSAPVLPSGSLPNIPVPPPVPEPGTWALMLGGIAVLAWMRQRRLVAQPVRDGRRG